ncbi:hypothetical protein BY458DRAFT_546224 [Sporodiniella umbellata]|nr:hypothetical protein BY458DRAFT_546224 [Sporodiniella umbellata]
MNNSAYFLNALHQEQCECARLSNYCEQLLESKGIACDEGIFRWVELAVRMLEAHEEQYFPWQTSLLQTLEAFNHHLQQRALQEWEREAHITIYQFLASFKRPKALGQCLSPSTKRSARYEQPSRPYLPSRTSSVSSQGSAFYQSCANCGKEKRGMPVCSQCKSQSYCTLRCLKEHQPVHQLDCRSFKT